jgi:acyl-CoA synthetase (AMP-forming)/AMP-acid ligase II
VIGVESPKRGKAIKAFVQMFPGERIEPKELTSFLGLKLSRYKIPQEVVVVDMLPRTSSGKVAKAELKHADAKNTIFLSTS